MEEESKPVIILVQSQTQDEEGNEEMRSQKEGKNERIKKEQGK